MGVTLNCTFNWKCRKMNLFYTEHKFSKERDEVFCGNPSGDRQEGALGGVGGCGGGSACPGGGGRSAGGGVVGLPQELGPVEWSPLFGLGAESALLCRGLGCSGEGGRCPCLSLFLRHDICKKSKPHCILNLSVM